MKLVEISIGSDYRGSDEERDACITAAFNAVDPLLPGVASRDTESLGDCPRYRDVKAIVSNDYLIELMVGLKGVDVKIKSVMDIDRLFPNVAAKQTTFSGDHDANFNSKCEVHISGHSLATYNETLLLSDQCTDALQGHIDEGWRILAVCPQPDQHRPDYIMARYSPNRDAKNSVHRSGALRWDQNVQVREIQAAPETVGVSISNVIVQANAVSLATGDDLTPF